MRSPDSWYGNHPPLANNKEGSIKQLGSLVKKLDKQPDMLIKYYSIIKEQLLLLLLFKYLKRVDISVYKTLLSICALFPKSSKLQITNLKIIYEKIYKFTLQN